MRPGRIASELNTLRTTLHSLNGLIQAAHTVLEEHDRRRKAFYDELRALCEQRRKVVRRIKLASMRARGVK